MVERKHFYFPNSKDARQAMNAWWAQQDAQGDPYTAFDTSTIGQDTDVAISDQSLADQPTFIAFLQENFAGKFTIHDTQQVRTWLEEVFGGA